MMLEYNSASNMCLEEVAMIEEETFPVGCNFKTYSCNVPESCDVEEKV